MASPTRVTQLAEASGVGAIVDAAALPIDPAAHACLAAQGDEELVAAAGASDDYELLFTVRPRLRGRLLAARVRRRPFHPHRRLYGRAGRSAAMERRRGAP